MMNLLRKLISAIKPKPQVFVAKGCFSPWYSSEYWRDKYHVTNIDESIPCQATVTCKGVTDMSSMFNTCSKLTSIDLSNFDTSKVVDMSWMLDYCDKLTSIDLSNFDTSNVYTTYAMFSECHSLTSLDLSSFDTSKVINMSYMFDSCPRLTTIKGVIDMKSCEYCGNMFTNCPKLTGVRIKNPPAGFEIHACISKSQYTIVS